MSSYSIENNKIEENIKPNEDKSIENNIFFKKINFNNVEDLDNNIEKSIESDKDDSIEINHRLKMINLNNESEIESNIENKKQKIIKFIYKNIKIKNNNLNINRQKICQICSEVFIPNNENTVIQCGHSFCNSCWYDFFSVKIQENQLTSIKCLDYKCKVKLNDKFIIHLLKHNYELIKKYHRYKLEYEILNNPNKKICPFPNCDSYLELKNPKIKDVTCSNYHTFCFLCLKKPHGKLACNQEWDNSIREFAKKNFLKKCPNCNIVSEKNSGCNHMTCPKCKYQWCWLCNGKYTYEHYLEGKCKGYQFFRPNDENEIQLALEGKIELNQSQEQDIYNYDIFLNIHETERHLKTCGKRNLRDMSNFEPIRRYNCCQTSLIFFIYLIIGHSFYSLASMPKIFMRKKITKILICASYFFLEISNFFPIIYFNIFMLFPYLIGHGFYGFIHYCKYFDYYSRQTKLYFTIFLLVVHIFFGGFVYMLESLYRAEHRPQKYVQMIFVLVSVLFEIIYFPLQLLINLVILLILIIKEHSHMLAKLNGMIVHIFGVQFIRDVY